MTLEAAHDWEDSNWGEHASRAIETVGDGVLVLSPEGRVLRANAGAARILGLSEREIVGREFNDKTLAMSTLKGRVIRGEDHPFSRAVRSRKFVAGRIISLKRSDGERRVVSVAALPVKNDNGSLRYILETFAEVTKLMHAREQRRLAEERASILFNKAPDAYYLSDLKGTFIDGNKVAEEITGYRKEEIIGKSYLSLGLLPPLQIPFAVKLLARNAMGLPTGPDEISLVRKDGNQITIEVSTYPVRMRNRVYVLGIARDVTERKKAKENLENSEERYRTLAEAAHDYIWIVGPDGRYQYVNSYAARMLGDEPENIVGRALDEYFPQEIVEREARNREVVFKEGEPIYTEDLMTFPTATVWYGTWLVALKNERDKVRAVLGVGRDITEARRAKELGEALNDINEIIHSTLEFKEVMHAVMARATKAIGAEAARIELRGENSAWSVLYESTTYKGAEDVEQRGTSRDLSALGLEIKKPLIMNDVQKETNLLNGDIAKKIEKLRMQSILAIPLMTRETLAGLLIFSNYAAARQFSNTQIDFANKLGASIMFALENVRLYRAQRQIAETLQEAFLLMPDKVPGLRFGYVYHSATEEALVGGDFYDLFTLGDNKVGILIGDVAGKGVEASAVTSLIKYTIKAYAHVNGSPAWILEKTNHLVSESLLPSTFSSLFFGILDTDTGNFVYANAGHPPVIVVKRNGEKALLTETSPLIGILKEMEYREARERVDRGDLLVLYTDGVVEARSGADFFGEKRLVETISKTDPSMVEELPKTILETVLRYTGGTLSDDVALLALTLDQAA